MHFYRSILPFVFGFLCIAYSATSQPIFGLHATSQNFKRVATDQRKVIVKFHHCCSPQPNVETAFMVRLRIKKKIQHDVGGSIPIVFEETGAPDFVGNTIGFDVTWVENGRQVSITEGKVVEVQTSSGKSPSYWKVELGVVPQAVHVVELEAGYAGTPGISINGSPVSNAKPGRTDTHK
ncbi:uncharacterized protein C8R40DRAFT_1165072 [Lentinula edodes]|uniref:uncharacterized protein n=1 Tax=Lentinula edodes TaxID=5353 RepID=UPI001E8EE2DE|nr:uncharacterized protein C8R40DRAFT_1165072 [Lentinula edodes]KAH7881662.1 hypothetical protein C8R40DRAFT_1165072 [Lentinula edodes]